MKTTLVILASVLLVLAIVGVTYAASSQSVTASVSVNGVASITVSAATLSFNSMDAGTTSPPTENPLSVTIDSNTAYSIKTQAGQANFTGGTGALSASRLQWATTLAGIYSNYSASAVNVFSGSAGGGVTTMYHKLTIPTGTQSGGYSLPITLSVTTP